MRLLLFTLLVAVPAALADEPEPKDKKPTQPREIKVKGLMGGRGLLGSPERITSQEGLAKVIADKEVRGEIARQVDFKKEYLLLFRWSGSGQDRIIPSVQKGKKGDEAVFRYQRGRTRDLRRHARLFAVPAGMDYKVER